MFGAALVHVQVRAADVREGDPHQHVGRTFDASVLHFADADVARSVVDKRLHLFSFDR